MLSKIAQHEQANTRLMAENKKLLVENTDLKDKTAQLVQKTLTLEFDHRLLEARIESFLTTVSRQK